MKGILNYTIIFLMILYGCNQPAGENDETISDTKVPVTLASIRIGPISEVIELNATTSFQDKALIKAPTSCYIDKVAINPGDLVSKNEELFILRTKESAALRADSSSSFGFSGLIHVRSSIDGIVITVDHPQGDYMQEGDQLCSIAVPGSLVFILEAPFELNSFIHFNSSVETILPDGKRIQTRIRSRLSSMSGNSQTQRYILNPLNPENLPENLIARIRIIKRTNPQAILLPKTCILTNETMRYFWVMKMINDSVAIKVFIRSGISEGDTIEITDPLFTNEDRFLASGNYGLGDIAKVIVTRQGK